MKKNEEHTNNTNTGLQGYPMYPSKEDLYAQDNEAKGVDPEDISKNKESTNNDDILGGNLDVPGSELDDKQENIGSEDEENNYYSLGGDDHNDLEEDNGEIN